MRRAVRAALAALTFGVALPASSALPANPAAAAPVETVITGEHLRLTSVTSDAMASLRPGQSATWDVGVAVTTPGDAQVDVTLQVVDATPDAFEVEVLRCDQRWTAAGCPGTTLALAQAPVATGASTAVERTDAEDEPWYRVVVTMVGDAPGSAAHLRLLAVGEGESLASDGGPQAPMPGTGAGVLGQVGLAAAAIGAGLALAALARRRRSARSAGGAP